MEFVTAAIFAAMLTLGALIGIKILSGRTPWEDYDLDKILVDLGVPALLFALVAAVAFHRDVMFVLVAGSIGMLIVHLGFVGYHKLQHRQDKRRQEDLDPRLGTDLDQARREGNDPHTPIRMM